MNNSQSLVSKPRTVNVVASTKSSKSLNIEKIARSLQHSIYEPDTFPGLIHRTLNPKATLIIFASGKITSTGTSSEKDATNTIFSTMFSIEKILQTKLLLDPIKIVNTVSVISMNQSLDLKKISRIFPKSNYNKIQFPGIFIRSHSKTTILAFSSGKLVSVGAVSEKLSRQSLTQVSSEIISKI